MQRKTSTTPTRVYSYGCSYRGVTVNADLVEDQYRKAHAYQQRLVELELHRRAQVRAVLGAGADVAALAEVVTKHDTILKADLAAATSIKQATRSKKLPPELSSRIAQTKQDLRAARDAWKAARRAATDDPATKAALDKTTADHNAAVKEARGACGLYWGTYLVLERAAEQQRKEKRDFSEKDDGPSALRYWKKMGAPSELRLCLIAAAKKVGAKITLIEPAMTTRRCSACGIETPWDQKTELVHTCIGCGAVWDQDHNATVNMLAINPREEGLVSSTRRARWHATCYLLPPKGRRHQ